MKTFTDNAGRTWTVAINVNALKRVRGLLGVNLLELIDGTLLKRLYADPILLCDVVYALCKPEADAQNVTDEQFGQAMYGDAIEHATTALLDEIVSFSPSPRDRRNLGRVLETTRRVMDRARDVVEQRLASGMLEAAAERALSAALNSSGAVPESSESIPVH